MIDRLTCLTFLLFSLPLFSQNQPAAFAPVEKIGVEQGLPQGFVTCLAQDREGFIWMGATNCGLVRYDGQRFRQFIADPFDPYSLSGNFVIHDASPLRVTIGADNMVQVERLDPDWMGYLTFHFAVSECAYPDLSNDTIAVNFSVGLVEICDGIDNDFDTHIDEGLRHFFYDDDDLDGFGDAATEVLECTAPAGYLTDKTDCDDTDAAIFPGATEVCNNIDDDCDALLDSNDPGVFDPEMPSVNCKNITLSLDANGQANIQAASVFQNGSDNCGAVNLVSVIPNSFNCSHLGTTEVVLIVNDGHNNVNSCTANVTVVDNAQPNIACKNVTVSLSSASQASISPALVYDGGGDNCGSVNLVSVVPNYFVCNNLGANTVTLTANDGHGNVQTCTSIVTLIDPIPPMAKCKDITVQLSGSGVASVAPANVNNVSTDNCPVSLSLSQTSFNCSNVGQNIVQLTASDPGGNSHQCSAVITVQDLVKPTALCKSAIINLDAGGQASLTTLQVNNNSSDACGIQSLSLSKTSFVCSDKGLKTVTLTVTDVNGNVKTCNASVLVKDAIKPIALCKNASLTLDANGSGVITSAMINNGSSDNCGIQTFTITPSTLSCANVGNNTVTLKATDPSGNYKTCTATVTVAPFITISGIPVANATCNQANGSITINAASAGGGQLGYSINGGASYSLTPVFNNLPPASYLVKVIAYGTNGCTGNGGSVVVSNVNSNNTFYKDLDNDGYSDGVSQAACAQPSGYKLAANLTATSGDCNDNDPLQFPGQTWYKDQDNDGYSNGQTLTQCAKPTNFKAASQLIATSGDCNDANAAIKPCATEVCNALDDDCDSQTDEGLSGATYVGNVTFSTPTQLNNWAQCYSVIQGNVTIQNSGVTSLAKLGNITKITGSLTIKTTGLDNLLGLNNLKKVGGSLTINNNGTLDSLAGLNGLDTVGTTLKIYLNPKLALCCPVKGLVNETTPRYVGGLISIYSNKDGCSSVAQINSTCPNFGGNGEIEEIGNWGNWEDVPADMDDGFSLTLFPNPADEMVQVRIGGRFANGSLQVFDGTGRIVFFEKIEAGMEQRVLNASEWKSGIYLIQGLLDGEILTKKVFVN